GRRLLVGDALGDAQRLRLVGDRGADAEDRVLGEVDALVEVAAFLAADQVDVDEAGEGGTAARVEAGTGVRLHALVDAAAPPDLLPQRPSAHLHTGGARGREDG